MNEIDALRAGNFLDLDGFRHADLFDPDRPAWEALARLSDYVAAHLVPENQGTVIEGVATIGDDVAIGEGTVIEPGAVIIGPVIIGRNCEVRCGCYLRGPVIAGDNVILGHACEFKHCVLFDDVEASHFNYVGDSVLGRRAHLGAGVILANFRLDRDLGGLTIPTEFGPVETGLEKLGAIIGDRTDIGSNSVLSPGSIIGRDSRMYPGTHWRGGILPDNHIVKVRQRLEVVERRR